MWCHNRSFERIQPWSVTFKNEQKRLTVQKGTERDKGSTPAVLGQCELRWGSVFKPITILVISSRISSRLTLDICLLPDSPLTLKEEPKCIAFGFDSTRVI